jgi:hypothetical protein
VQTAVTVFNLISDNYSISNYIPSNFVNYFIFSANFETINNIQLLHILPFYGKNNPKILINSSNLNNIFFLDSNINTALINNFNLSNSIILKTLKFINFDTFNLFSFVNNIEYIFNIKTLEYNYIGVFLSVFYFILFFFFFFLI